LNVAFSAFAAGAAAAATIMDAHVTTMIFLI
jgi:hypothetical protein